MMLHEVCVRSDDGAKAVMPWLLRVRWVVVVSLRFHEVHIGVPNQNKFIKYFYMVLLLEDSQNRFRDHLYSQMECYVNLYVQSLLRIYTNVYSVCLYI